MKKGLCFKIHDSFFPYVVSVSFQSHTEQVRYVRGKNHNLRLLRTNKTGNNYIL